MKAFFVGLFFLRTVTAGEISDLFYNAARERRDAAAERRSEALKQIEKEADPKKKLELLSSHPDLQVQLPPTGRFVVLTNNGAITHGIVTTNHGVSEFGLETKEVTFFVTSDGKCRQVRRSLERSAPPLVAAKPKERSGTVSIVEFHRIAQFLVEINYWGLDDDYDVSASDFPAVFSTAVRNEKRKSVRNYAGAGPSRLWAVEQLIGAMMAKADWSADR